MNPLLERYVKMNRVIEKNIRYTAAPFTAPSQSVS